jgi:hypothetical protein
MQNRVAVGTRFFGKNPADADRLKDFCNSMQQVSEQVYVAIHIEEDKSNAINLEMPNTELFHVVPWGKFVAPLNALVSKAILSEADLLLVASVETRLNDEQFELLNSHMQVDTLVVGVALEGHIFNPSPSPVRAGGREVPWNTLAIWNLHILGRLGFPLVGDALFNTKQSGVEEVTTIAVYQTLYGIDNTKAKLISIPGIDWDVSHFNSERKQQHEQKMASKESRPVAQLEWARLSRPHVWHIR